MIFAGLIMVCFVGYSVLKRFSKDCSKIEIICLSFLVGIAVETMIMFLLDLLHLPFNATILTLISILIIVVLNYKSIPNFRKSFAEVKWKPHKPKLNNLNIGWWLIFLLICFLLIGSFAKSLYWPTTAYDSVAGYDLMGKAIAHEGKIHVSLFDINHQGNRAFYPPLIEGSFAFAYLFGSESSKMITSITYLSLVLIFYTILRKYVNSINAILFCLFLIITPEMFAHSSLSLSNMPAAVYAGIGLIYLFISFDKSNENYFFIASILLGLTVWARNDGIAFAGAGFVVLLYYAIKMKTWKKILIYSLFIFLPFIIWNLYLKFVIEFTQDRFVSHLFWDFERIQLLFSWIKRLVFSTSLYGLTFYIFFIALLLNIKNILRDKLLLFMLILLAFIFYSALYYQLDDSILAPLSFMMETSYKRALFFFVPLMLFYASTSKVMQQLFIRIDNFRIGNPIHSD